MSTRNVRAVIANLKQYGEGAKGRAKVVVEQSADRVYTTAQSLCPVDTGYMKAHMRKEFTPAGASIESLAQGVEVPMPTLSVLSARKDWVPSFCQPPAVAETGAMRAPVK